MGLLNFQITGDTTSLPLSIGPPVGYAWRLSWATELLTTSSTTGTRSLGLYAIGSLKGTGYAELLNTNSETGTATSYDSSFSGQVNTSVTPDVVNEVWNSQEIVIDNNNELQLLAQAVTGDTYKLQFVVEEFVP